MKKISDIKADIADYWKESSDIWKEEQEWMKVDVAALIKRFNHTKGEIQALI